jgi:hypothetical protein
LIGILKKPLPVIMLQKKRPAGGISIEIRHGGERVKHGTLDRRTIFLSGRETRARLL